MSDIPTGSLTQRAVWWALRLSEELIIDADLREAVPEGEVYVLPENDLELKKHNLRLGAGRGATYLTAETPDVPNFQLALGLRST
jgi:hypothetical protein